jgi:FkbM family methyltransferase
LPPSAKEIVLNIGSNKDPILPQETSGPCALTIAFEPIIPELVPEDPQVMVVPAAVSDSSSLATMYKYNRDGVSSSLSRAAENSFWNTGKHNMGIKIVPVVSMADVLQSIPPGVTIDFIQTDAQGFDFSIIQAGIHYIRERGVRFLKTETYADNVITYEGVENDLCLHWIPFMAVHGYTLVGTTVNYNQKFQTADKVMEACARQEMQSDPKAGLKEVDALWKLSTITEAVEESRFAYPVLSRAQSRFIPQDYEVCKKPATKRRK